MTAQSDPYVRVYYRIRDDERFVGVYRDDASYPQSMEFDQFRQSSKPLAPTANCPAPTR